MNATAPDQPRIFARTAAVRIGEAILICFAVVILLAGMDKAQRERLESYEETTAVGDRAYFQLPSEVQKPPQPVVNFRGQPLYPASGKRVEIRDTKMLRLGKDDSGQHYVYSNRENVPTAEGEPETKGEKFLFLKLAPGEYLKVRTAESSK